MRAQTNLFCQVFKTKNDMEISASNMCLTNFDWNLKFLSICWFQWNKVEKSETRVNLEQQQKICSFAIWSFASRKNKITEKFQKDQEHWVQMSQLIHTFQRRIISKSVCINILRCWKNIKCEDMSFWWIVDFVEVKMFRGMNKIVQSIYDYR